MKIISLNLWGGRVAEPLKNFLKERAGKIDIFCFQEIYNEANEGMSDEERKHIPDLLTELRKILPDYNYYFKPVIKNLYGIGIFVRKNISVLEEGEIIVSNKPNYSGHGGDHTRNFQWIKIEYKKTIYNILNIHGIWDAVNKKTDTQERIEQSNIILNFMKSLKGPIILCGDFNLLPDTKSMKMIENNMINLIKKKNITSTRSPLYKKPEKFADYILVSKEVKISRFEVLQDTVSDHLPLFLEIN